MYTEYYFRITPPQPGTDILLAELAELGFESFVETPDGLKAYIRENQWEEEQLGDIRALHLPEFNITYSKSNIAEENWNASWEESFEPIRLGKACVVRAPFHKKEPATFDIVIEPKMSFGTGHHETTYLMLQWMLEMPFKGKSVLDMGCGTGVLAILAAMKEAACVDAIDIDPWSFANSLENVQRNRQDHIRVRQGDASLLQPETFDVILANINRNILLADIPRYADALTKKGSLLVSGFYLEDLAAISEKCGQVNLKFEKNRVNNNWVCAKYVF
jgi:ribosomal protein L11 methyltransferase